MTHEKAIDAIMYELKDAKAKHPVFPSDIVHMTAIMAEEAGEAVQAANDVKWLAETDLEKAEIVKEDYVQEIFHTAAMCIRILEHFE